MILLVLFLLPLAGGLVAWPLARRSPAGARWVSLGAMLAGLLLLAGLWASHRGDLSLTGGGAWLEQLRLTWIPQIGSTFFLAMDGLGLLLVGLCYLIGALSVLVSWREIDERVGFFHFHLLASIAALIGVFMALDLFLFYFLFEIMLVPMYFLIVIWGHERKIYAAIKFFIFTQVGGLLMLVSILALYFVHHHATGVYTFDYLELLGTQMSGATATWIMLGFFAAFAIKLPALPLHTWLPDAHTQAPTAGSLVLAGLLIKVGAYGMLRFQVPLFPQAASQFAPVAMGLGVAGILYGALLAFGQRDLKRLVAYTSVSHMGFVLLGIFVWNTRALQGVMLEIVCHALSTGGLFVLAGIVQERTGTRDMQQLGGAWGSSPAMGAATLVFVLASLGLPGLGNFVAEFLILWGTWSSSRPATAVAAAGLVTAVIYAVWVLQRVFQGPEVRPLPDLTAREGLVMGALIAPLLILGLYPAPVLTTARQSAEHLQRAVPQLTLAKPSAHPTLATLSKPQAAAVGIEPRSVAGVAPADGGGPGHEAEER